MICHQPNLSDSKLQILANDPSFIQAQRMLGGIEIDSMYQYPINFHYDNDASVSGYLKLFFLSDLFDVKNRKKKRKHTNQKQAKQTQTRVYVIPHTHAQPNSNNRSNRISLMVFLRVGTR